MTQDQLAKQAGVTRHTIMALEALKYFPSLLLAFASLASLEYPSSGSLRISRQITEEMPVRSQIVMARNPPSTRRIEPVTNDAALLEAR